MQDNNRNNFSNIKSGKIMFLLSVISFFISSSAIIFMPLGSFEPGVNNVLAFSLAVAFWLFFILGFVFVLILNRLRKKDITFARIDGIIFLRFFQNKPATVFDLWLIAGVLTLVIYTFIIRTLPGTIVLAGTFITVFSLEMHGLFNGKNYQWLCSE